MTKSDDSALVQDLINGPLSFLASISPQEKDRRAYLAYLRALPPDSLKSIVYGGRSWQSHAAMCELLGREGRGHLSDEEFNAARKVVCEGYWSEYVRPKELAYWREYITSGRFYRDKAAENDEIRFARENRSLSTYKKKLNGRSVRVPPWVRSELRDEIRAARKAALLEGLKV